MRRHAIPTAGILFSASVLILATITGHLWTTGQILGALFFIVGGLMPAIFRMIGEE